MRQRLAKATGRRSPQGTRTPRWRLGGVAASTLLVVLAVSLPSGAIPPVGEPPPETCLDNVWAEFNASPAVVALGQRTTLNWTVHAEGCPLTLVLDGVGNMHLAGSWGVTPSYSRWWTLTARRHGLSKTFYAWVTVDLPRDAYGRINVTITSNDHAGLFMQAVSSSESMDAVVYIQNHVSLDLSYEGGIHIQPGVQILGGRSSNNPGPLLFTNTYPGKLFIIGQYLNVDNVRISGIRLQGADQGVADGDSLSSTGIWINSSLNVEIDNNEIYGWRNAAVSVTDDRNRIDRRNGRGAVRIHDNYLHHNQKVGKGYGVVVSQGAYALVEKNHFANNRHGIAGAGDHGDGYFLYRNLITNSGGQHEVVLGIDVRTHQIDMHGQEPWCVLFWCASGYRGVAGEYMDVRYNAILYDVNTAIKVRGRPTQRMDVAHNKFAHSNVWADWHNAGAMQQTDGTGAFNQWDNSFGGYYHYPLEGVCDFDGDGVFDSFEATGATWLYASGAAPGNGRRYLNSSTLLAYQLEFSDVNGDGICDVRVPADGRVSLGGRTPLQRLARTDILSTNAAAGQLRISRLEGGVITGQVQSFFRQDQDVVATGDFDGDGDADILLRNRDVLPLPNGQGGYRPTRVLFVQDGAVAGEAFWGASPAGGGVEGVADFDGDDAQDVLWRDANGVLELWYWGVSTDVNVSWRNLGGVVGLDWDIKAVGDFNGDGYADIAWRNDQGLVTIWLMVGSIFKEQYYLSGTDPAQTWKIEAVGDFDGDGRVDLLWRHVGGGLAISWGATDYVAYPSWQNQGIPTDLTWQVKGVSDFNGDGRADILWRRNDGLGVIWMMNGGSWAGDSSYLWLDGAWPVQGLLLAK